MCLKTYSLRKGKNWSVISNLMKLIQRSIPRQWSTVVQIKDLIWVQQLAKTADKLCPLASAGLDVDEHQQRLDPGRDHARFDVR